MFHRRSLFNCPDACSPAWGGGGVATRAGDRPVRVHGSPRDVRAVPGSRDAIFRVGHAGLLPSAGRLVEARGGPAGGSFRAGDGAPHSYEDRASGLPGGADHDRQPSVRCADRGSVRQAGAAVSLLATDGPSPSGAVRQDLPGMPGQTLLKKLFVQPPLSSKRSSPNRVRTTKARSGCPLRSGSRTSSSRASARAICSSSMLRIHAGLNKPA